MNLIRSLFMKSRDVYSSFVESWNTMPIWTSRDYRTNLNKRYTLNELIYACVTLNSMTSSQVQMRVKDRKTGMYNEEHPLRKLIQNPNPFMSEADLWETVIMLQLLAGRAVLEKERNNAGEVIGLWPLRPDWLSVVPSKKDIIAGFLFGPPGHEKDFIPYRDTIDMPLRNPGSPIVPFFTLAPVTVAARVVDVDSQVTDYIKLFFERGGIPPGILKTRQKLIESQVEVLRRRWRERYGGYQNWTEPAILDSDAEYQRLGSTFEEMGFIILDRRNESRICMILQIPPIVVGAYAGLELGSYDNYLTARKAWWEDANVPRFERMLNRVQIEMSYEYSDNPMVMWDYSKVEALRENREVVWRLAADAFRTGGITKNMYLQEIGYSPIGPQGDIFLHPLAYIEVPLKSSRKKELIESKVDLRARDKHETEMQSAIQGEFDSMFENLKKEIEEHGVEAILGESSS